MLVKLSESPGTNPQVLGNKNLQNYSVYNDSNLVIGRAVDALLDEGGNFRFVVVQLDQELANKQVLLAWEGQGVDIYNERIYVKNVTQSHAANLPSYNPSAPSRQAYIDEEIIRLLQERVLVNKKRHKIGEIIVRKEIETRIVQVPVRREKLIVEQISPERKELVSIDLGLSGDERVTLVDGVESQSRVSREFASRQEAIEFLQSFDDSSNLNLYTVQINLASSKPSML